MGHLSPSSGLGSAPQAGVGLWGPAPPGEVLDPFITCCSPDAQECTLKVQDGKFKLQDLLVVPMQRVLKYHLLLKVRPGLSPPLLGSWIKAWQSPGAGAGAHRWARLRYTQATNPHSLCIDVTATQ